MIRRWSAEVDGIDITPSGTFVPPRLEVIAEPVEVTRSGLFGGQADTMKRYIAGRERFYIDGVEVDEAAFMVARMDAHLAATAPGRGSAPWPWAPPVGQLRYELWPTTKGTIGLPRDPRRNNWQRFRP